MELQKANENNIEELAHLNLDLMLAEKYDQIKTSAELIPRMKTFLELEKGILQGQNWKYYSSNVYEVDKNAAEYFDKQFEFRKKEYTYTQEEFSIASRAYLLELNKNHKKLHRD